MNHQGLFWNVQCVATVVLRKQLNFRSAVIRSNRSSCFVLDLQKPTCLFDLETVNENEQPLCGYTVIHFNMFT